MGIFFGWLWLSRNAPKVELGRRRSEALTFDLCTAERPRTISPSASHLSPSARTHELYSDRAATFTNQRQYLE